MADVYFWFAAYDSKEAEIVGISSIGDNSREVELQAGEQYRFEVRQSEGMGFSYEINLEFVE